ncbi:MAG: hypothetical protein IJW31_06775 [Lentisphaeria bacterium]|nr:hypothetical protein [Lentisphaeria bacterium]MBR7128301.1 hypothetical protein [Lentisphaeria bacterium]
MKSFRKLCITLVAIFALILLSGCGDKILINGKYYYILSAEEEQAMLDFARITLCSPTNDLSPAACSFIRSTEPKIFLTYSGNKSGYAVYEWIFGDMYVYKISCRGKFLTDEMEIKVISQRLLDDIDEKGQKRGNVSFQPFKEL